MNEKEKKVIVVLYRSFGVEKGRGYQPINIFSALTKANLLKQMYVFWIRNNKDKHPLLKGQPKWWLGLMFCLQKVKNTFKIKGGNYLFYQHFFDKFIARQLRNTHNENIIFNYFPSKKLLEKLKKKGNTLHIYVGQLHPQEWLEEVQTEYRKCHIAPDQKLLKEIKTEIELLPFFSSVLLMSSYANKTYKKHSPSLPTYITPLGVDYKLFSPGDEKERIKNKIFIFVGRITCLKGIVDLVAAWQELDLKDAKLWIVGGMNSNEKDYFTNLFNKTKNLEYKGYMPVSELYKQAFAMIHPTVTGGFEKITCEAMAAELPVITTEIAAHFHKNNETSIIVPLRDKEKLKTAILEFYHNPEKAIAMGKQGRLIAKQNGWDAFQQHFKKAVQSILKEK